MQEKIPSRVGAAGAPLAGAVGSSAEEEGTTNAARVSNLLNEAILPLIGRLRGEARTLAGSARRGEVADRATHIDELAAGAEAALTALTRLAALDTERRPLNLTTLDLGDVVMSLLARWKTQAPSHAFELALPGELPLITGDSALTEAALDALIEDAVALTAPGDSIRVSIRPEAEEVVVSLRPQIAKVWFARDDPSTAKVARSDAELVIDHNRIHFSLAQAIVTRHGGRAWHERDAVGNELILRAAWPLVAQPEISSQSHWAVAREAASEVAPSPRSVPANGQRQTALVWEPETRMARYLRSNLEARQMRAVMASTLDDVLRLIEVEEPDVLLLDATSEKQVTAILERATRLTEAPTLLLAAEYDAEVCARLLDAGASDYIAKPLHIDELFARMRTALRAQRGAETATRRESRFSSGELVVDFEQRRVTVGEREIALSKTEFKLLKTLAQNAGKVLSHEWLLDHVWGPGYRHETEFVWVYVRRLRRKIEPDPKSPRYVLTAPGVGYRLAKS